MSEDFNESRELPEFIYKKIQEITDYFEKNDLDYVVAAINKEKDFRAFAGSRLPLLIRYIIAEIDAEISDQKLREYLLDEIIKSCVRMRKGGNVIRIDI